MTRRQARKAKAQPSFWKKLRSWRPMWSSEQVSRELIGWLLLILAALTALGLWGLSSGAVLSWWATAMRHLFGGGAYLAVIFAALVGIRLLLRGPDRRWPLGPERFIGIELVFLALLAALHAPLILQSSADAAFKAAQDGRGGGLVGWVLATPLLGVLGAAVGGLVLLATFALGLVLLLPITWKDIIEWIRFRGRSVITAYRRWRLARQGTPVVPEVPETPWWEEEPEPGAKKPRKATKPRRRKMPVKARSADGSLPPIDLLDPASSQSYGDADVRFRIQLIEETLASFGVPVRVVEVNEGPTVTQFGLEPGYIERRVAGGQVRRQRVRVARIASLSNDLALALAAAPIRIEAPVPGRSVVGLEVPNAEVSLVSLRGVLESDAFRRLNAPLAIALGEDVSGHAEAVDLGLMPHLLIAGATGSGKSVCINAVICSLLFNNGPQDLKLLMVDPKMVELVGYSDIPHLLAPVVVDIEQVVAALSWVTRQMDERYKLLHKIGTRNLDEYNKRMRRRKNREVLPRLVVVIDELADMMMVAPDEVERHICRVAQMGRATGIHLVIATQRPSVDVVTGLIKANFPARISFAVTSQVDSRVILDQGGAESLLGRGDMLFQSPQQSAPIRLQGCFVSDQEIGRLTQFWRSTVDGSQQAEAPPLWTQMEDEQEADSMLDQAIQTCAGRKRISTSFIQRQLRIGFPRAARLVDQLEDQGVVGPDEGAGRGRKVLLGEGIDLDEIAERLPGVEPG
jgi:S-DNA-T family DNA segregation ATPase FtsK/SpoIIIE